MSGSRIGGKWDVLLENLVYGRDGRRFGRYICSTRTNLGVKVHRPIDRDFSKIVNLNDWVFYMDITIGVHILKKNI